MRIFLAFLFTAAGLSAASAPQEFSSGPTRVHVVELFTSEGCSSCPPAEAWIGALRSNQGVWRDFVPLAWHVDYWDDLGWKDRFASTWATARERAFAKAWKSNTVYTPCLVLDGKELTSSRVPTASKEEAGILHATFENGRTLVNFLPASPGKFEAHIAMLGGEIVSKVTRGENSGSTLRHDFVVLSSEDAPLVNGAASIKLPILAKEGVKTHALAVWITRAGSLEPVQATGGPLRD